ncbi:hypothetical protein HXX25_02815 [Hyphobacterium sp. CCMP332]|uniref:hypothetical protein n=1 Tax=Hyphobacterium sp. CCMP332 TaxID=2749086 RepID=UPI001650058B|nr:hypothetical protein [Hyphobacterium sp. CCMP332]QNL18362.1 hypothetical protein HXX25_02815 [Hyphobacterium sp. CCMP332]
MKYAIMAAALSVGFLGAAVADEVWTDEFGNQVIYQSQIGSTAVFTGPEGETYFIENLAGNFSDRRGDFAGFWLVMPQDAGEEQYDCASTRIAPDGRSSTYWGPVSIRFDRPAFPTGFTMTRGYCADLTSDYASELVGTTYDVSYSPVTAGGAETADACNGNSVFPIVGEFVFEPGRRYPSPCGDHYLTFQTDGNLVVYTSAGQPIWALNSRTNRWGQNRYAVFQSDGNLATYTGRGRGFIWSARNVASPAGSQLHLTEDGELQIIAPNGTVLLNGGRG